jgi:hypothetical protein
MKFNLTFRQIVTPLLLASAALLASCGGGENKTAAGSSILPTTNTSTLTQQQMTAMLSSVSAIQHKAGPGRLVGSKVEVMNAFDLSKKVFYSTTTDSNGQFFLNMSGADLSGLYLVRVSGGDDWDVNNDGVTDTTPKTFTGALHALASAVDLSSSSIRVSILSDMVFRLLGENASTFGELGLTVEMQRLAGVLLKQDLDGKTGMSAHDLLVFDATRADHRAALNFDWGLLIQPTADGKSILDKYYAGTTDVAAAYRNSALSATPGLMRTLQEEQNSPYMTLKVSMQGNGQISGTALKGVAIKTEQDTRSLPMFKDPALTTVSVFEAAETDNLWRFHSWVGCTKTSGVRCEVVLAQDVAIQARFELKTPTLKPEVKSLAGITPAAGLTNISFTGTTATVLTRDAATKASLLALQIGSVLKTGHRDHPLIWVKSVPTQNDTPVAGGNVHTTSFEFTEANLGEIYAAASVIADPEPMRFDEIKAITLSSEATGTVKTVLPWPDYSASVANGNVAAVTPTWYVTLSADSKTCNGYGSDTTVQASLTAAWASVPKAYPFNSTTLAQCVTLNQFTMVGDLSAYVAAKVGGESDLANGHNDSTNLIAKARVSSATTLAAIAPKKGQNIERKGEPIWLAGVGPAVDVGQGLFIAQRSDGTPGFQLISAQNKRRITSAEAVKFARSDCSLRGDAKACALVATLSRERAGLQNTGIPLLGSPLEMSFSNGSYFTATISLLINIDVSPRVSSSWGVTDVNVSAGAGYMVRPELGLKLALGGTWDRNVDTSVYSNKRKFDKNKSNARAQKNRGGDRKQLIKVDLGRLVPSVGAVADISVNLVLGIEAGGEISVEIKPFVELTGDFSVNAGYRCWFDWFSSGCGSWVNPSFSKPKMKAGYSLTAGGEAQIAPYAEVNVSAGIRGLASDVGKVYLKASVPLKGQISTSMTYNIESRTEYVSGYQMASSVVHAGGCSQNQINNDECQCQEWWNGPCYWGTRYWWVHGYNKTTDLRCISSPDISLGLYFALEAGVEVSTDGANWPINKIGLRQNWKLYENEWPLWEYPAQDGDSTPTGCTPIPN